LQGDGRADDTRSPHPSRHGPQRTALLGRCPALSCLRAEGKPQGFSTHPRVGFVGAWVFGVPAPASSIVTLHTEIGAGRRMYLPLIGVVVLVVIAGCWLSSQAVGPPFVSLAVSANVAAASLLAWGIVRRTSKKEPGQMMCYC
jgi:hypothetical protein